jgi:4-hydroxythreonine-4-phosphate dehydrogenase
VPAPISPLIAVTAGEPAGIGPDICLALARGTPPTRIVIIADRNVLEERARMLHLEIDFIDFARGGEAATGRGRLVVRHVPAVASVSAGVLDAANSRYVLKTLETALEFIADDELVEITPASIRLRKRLLKEHERKKASRSR